MNGVERGRGEGGRKVDYLLRFILKYMKSSPYTNDIFLKKHSCSQSTICSLYYASIYKRK